MRIAFACEFDGRGFCGFQSQPSRCAVQDALEAALAGIAAAPVRVHAAGRTDAGVHATSMIGHFDTDAARPPTAWVRGVNALLPGTLAMRWAHPVDATFHARYAATARRYTYVLLDRAERPGLMAGRVGWYHRPLAIEAMRDAAQALMGTQDFSSFRAAECQAPSPVRTLHELAIARAGVYVRLDFRADGFLHHMIRNLVAALVVVGSGRQPATWVGELLAARDRTRGAPTFAADGLYFTGADYPAAHGLPPTCAPVSLV
ncbi:MAG: tRNA pseudouridine(38-40) synthase TruA [Proteobacteria bacterium]|nr:tRNA pseudouridine(38-40) synthase TruA [Pseudomonadota bacterium]